MMVMMITTYNEEGLTHTRRVRMYCGSLFISYICSHSQSTSTWWGDDTMSKVVAFLSTTLHSQLPRCNPQVPCFYCWNYRVVEGWKSQRHVKWTESAKKIQLFSWFDSSQAGIKKSLGLYAMMFVDVQGLRSLKWQKLCLNPDIHTKRLRKLQHEVFALLIFLGVIAPGIYIYNWPSVQTMHGGVGQWQDHANFLWSMVALTAAERRVAGCFKQSHLMMDVLHLICICHHNISKRDSNIRLELVAWKFCLLNMCQPGSDVFFD